MFMACIFTKRFILVLKIKNAAVQHVIGVYILNSFACPYRGLILLYNPIGKSVP